MPFDTSLGVQSLDVLFNVLGDRDSLSVKAAGFPRIENASLDSVGLALQVASDRLGNGLVRSGLDLTLASALVTDSDVPNLALFSLACHWIRSLS